MQTHQSVELHEVVLGVEVVSKILWQKESFLAEKTLIGNRFRKPCFLKKVETALCKKFKIHSKSV